MADAPLTAGIDLVVNDKGLPEAIRKLGIDAESTRRRIEALASANERVLTAPSNRSGRVDLFADLFPKPEKAREFSKVAEEANASSLKLSQGLRLLAWQLDLPLPGSRFIFLGGVVRDLGRTISEVGVSGGLNALKTWMGEVASTATSAGKAILAFAMTPLGATLTAGAVAFGVIASAANDATTAFNNSQKAAREFSNALAKLREIEVSRFGSPNVSSLGAQASAAQAQIDVLTREQGRVGGLNAWSLGSFNLLGVDVEGTNRDLDKQKLAWEGILIAARDAQNEEISGRRKARAANEEYQDDFDKRLRKAQQAADLAGLEGAAAEKAALAYEGLSASQRQLIEDEIDLKHAREDAAKAAKEEEEAARRAAEKGIKAAERLAEAKKRQLAQEADDIQRQDEQLKLSLRTPARVVEDRIAELTASRNRPTGISEGGYVRGIGMEALRLIDASLAEARSKERPQRIGFESLESAYGRIAQAAATQQKDDPVVKALEKERSGIVNAIKESDYSTVLESIDKRLKDNLDKIGALQ